MSEIALIQLQALQERMRELGTEDDPLAEIVDELIATLVADGQMIRDGSRHALPWSANRG